MVPRSPPGSAHCASPFSLSGKVSSAIGNKDKQCLALDWREEQEPQRSPECLCPDCMHSWGQGLSCPPQCWTTKPDDFPSARKRPWPYQLSQHMPDLCGTVPLSCLVSVLAWSVLICPHLLALSTVDHHGILISLWHGAIWAVHSLWVPWLAWGVAIGTRHSPKCLECHQRSGKGSGKCGSFSLEKQAPSTKAQRPQVPDWYRHSSIHRELVCSQGCFRKLHEVGMMCAHYEHPQRTGKVQSKCCQHGVEGETWNALGNGGQEGVRPSVGPAQWHSWGGPRGLVQWEERSGE